MPSVLSNYDSDKQTYVDQYGNPFEYPEQVKILVASLAVQDEGWEDLNNNGSEADEAFDKAFGPVGTFDPFNGTVGAVYGSN